MSHSKRAEGCSVPARPSATIENVEGVEPVRAQTQVRIIRFVLAFIKSWGAEKKSDRLIRLFSAPQVGLEPTTLRLTAECSAIELLRNMESGGDLLSRTVTSQVPSALKGLTSVFGMGTGGTPSSLPPEMVSFVWKPFSFLYCVSDFSRPSDLPFLPPSGLEVFSHPDNCTVRFSWLTIFN